MKNTYKNNNGAEQGQTSYRSKAPTKIIVETAMFASIIVLLSQIALPMPFGVPITLQTFAVALCGYVLGWKYGLMSTGVYVLLGAVGLPVFANFKGGINMLFGMTGGFIFGFLILAVFCGLNSIFKKRIIGIVIGILGLILCHILGVIQFSAVTSTPLAASALMVSVPYLLKDIISIIAAYVVGMAVKKRLASLI